MSSTATKQRSQTRTLLVEGKNGITTECPEHFPHTERLQILFIHQTQRHIIIRDIQEQKKKTPKNN